MPNEQERIRIAARYVARSLVALADGTDAPPLPEEITYKGVFSLAKRHSLASTLYYLFEDEVKDDPTLSAKLANERDVDYAKNLVQTREFDSVTRAFSSRGVRFLPMKGFLFKELWARPEHRTMSDMDIFVSPETTPLAEEILVSLGYTRSEEGNTHTSFEKPPYVNIELHKKLDKGSSADFSEWIEREDHPGWYVMPDEDFLVYAIAHMHKHYEAGGSGMRSVFDIFLFLRKNENSLNRELVREKLQALSLCDFYDLLCELISLWFGDGGNKDDVLLDFELYTATGGTYGSVKNRVEYSVKNKKRSKISYFFARLFLPYSKMVYIYKWLKPLPFLLPIAWIMRVFSALLDGRAQKELKALENTDVDGRGNK